MEISLRLNWQPVVAAALREDIGSGDITTLTTVGAEKQAQAQLLAKEPCTLAGAAVLDLVFSELDPQVQVRWQCRDGQPLAKGQVVATIYGAARSLLQGERVALNFLQRLSGIATRTAAFAQAVAGTQASIVDTRKTTPGLRGMEKYAVRVGGGVNHRFGLDDGVLIKENHIYAAGGVATAVKLARSQAPHSLRIEVETQNLAEVEEAVDAGADTILLDNMDLATLEEAVALVAGQAVTEASGGIDLQRVAAVAATGVDLISIGALTHSSPAVDLSLLFG